MASFEFLAIILTGIGLIVSILYYTFTLQNANKTQKTQLETRQAQLFMGFYTAWLNPEFYREMIEVAFLWEWEDYDDFMSKYWMSASLDNFTKFGRALTYLEGVGVLMKRGLIDPSMMDDLNSGYVISMWEKYESLILESRIRLNQPQYSEFFEYLYNEIKKQTTTDHPELKDTQMKWG